MSSTHQLPHMERVISQNVVQHPLSAEDAILYPQATTRGPPNDAFLECSPTGLVEAKQAENGGSLPAATPLHHRGSQSTLVTSHKGDAEKGLQEEDAKLVTWRENDGAFPFRPSFPSFRSDGYEKQIRRGKSSGGERYGRRESFCFAGVVHLLSKRC